MASNTEKTRRRRKNKARPNKENLRKYFARIRQNVNILRQLEKEEK